MLEEWEECRESIDGSRSMVPGNSGAVIAGVEEVECELPVLRADVLRSGLGRDGLSEPVGECALLVDAMYALNLSLAVGLTSSEDVPEKGRMPLSFDVGILPFLLVSTLSACRNTSCCPVRSLDERPAFRGASVAESDSWPGLEF